MIDEQKYKDMLSEIIEHYGLYAQFDQLVEESAELIQSINKFKRSCGNGQPVEINRLRALTRVLEEIADVEVCIDQIKLHSPDNVILIDDIKFSKAKRQADRINGGTQNDT